MVEALSQVRAHGAEAVSLRAVAQAVGVSPSAAYHHFADKTAILIEVADRGANELDRRTADAAGRLPVDDAAAGLARLRAVGAAYIGFAVDEPHLFRHTFGPYCAMTPKFVNGGGDGGVPPSDDDGHNRGSDSAYGLLVDTLDRLDALGALRRRDGLDLVAWAAVHGFASLVLDGFLPADASSVLVDVLATLVVSPSV